MRILIVDDEADLREILQFNIQAWGYDTLCAESAEKALEILNSGQEVDLILLDVMLPGMSGYKCASEVRNTLKLSVPIIFLTARTSENDLLTGFSAGGDDYITKPFSINEVQARIKAVLKRSLDRPAGGDQISIGPLKIDPLLKKAYVNGVDVLLSKKEYDILLLLCTHPGQSFTRRDFIDQLWKDSPYITERTVDVHIARIRAKLGDACKNLISNRIGFGYSVK
jgi:two-component system, OmpR family, alkaline phosphatase synthesis response regulator PhoP